MESMTGVAVVQGESDGISFVFTARCVNGKSFDLRCRLPAGCDGLENTAREVFKKNFARGSFAVSLEISQTSETAANVRINENLLDSLCVCASRYAERYPYLTVSLDGLLGVTGVVEKSADAALPNEAALTRGLEKLAADLKASRVAEGQKIAVCLQSQLDEMAALAQKAQEIAESTPDILSERLKAQIAAVKETAGVSEDRLAQEVALLLIKSDVREEIDRLKVHVKTGRDLLQSKEPCGKKLDFLCQELNRETNTMCSKSADIALTQTGLALKSVIDQFREQVQNIE